MARQHASYGAVDLEAPATDASWTHEAASTDGRWSARGVSKLSRRDGNASSGGEALSSALLTGAQGWICVLSALSGFVFGYDLCVMVIALSLIQEVRLVPPCCLCARLDWRRPLYSCVREVQDFGLSTAYAEAVVSTHMVGAVVGSLGGGLMADWCVL